MLQVPAARELLVKLMLPLPAVAVTVPLQLLTSPFGVDTTRFVARLSVKLASIGTTLPLVTLKVIVLAVFSGTVAGLKLLLI